MRKRPFPMLPSEPLVALVEARGGVTACCGADPRLRRAYARAKEAGELTETTADLLSLRLLGVHPWELWDEWFPAVYA